MGSFSRIAVRIELFSAGKEELGVTPRREREVTLPGEGFPSGRNAMSERLSPLKLASALDIPARN